ncbi:TIGR04222 domain-containing membrane protein [Phytohabitans aurantiacus]|uniref:TIGR04222 domain-containing membrane protein n=1 Tax=Phytohabitans aurantiacus TaxID=3016789 RepID=A0ABQ5QP02_9ACTN|nr:TIGR04222 domain-containing membrane protein [Phytohabitans aurantiacus]GLH96298.1 hypothetical protein Pa4123_15720 [Phytohabitans aurantiacus]
MRSQRTRGSSRLPRGWGHNLGHDAGDRARRDGAARGCRHPWSALAALGPAVAALRRAALIDADADGTLTATGPRPTDRPALEVAIHRAAEQRWRYPVSLHDAVSPLLDPLAHRVRRAGWIVATPGAVSAGERGCLAALALLLAIVWWGVALTLTTLVWSYDPQSTVAIVLTIGTLIPAFAIFAAVCEIPRQTTAGERLLHQARARHHHLAPGCPITTPDEAAISVALWGTPALWAQDSGFAERYRVPRHRDS